MNGDVKLASRASVGGDVSTVQAKSNSMAPRSAASSSRDNGDIDLTDGARVRGGIHVKKNNGVNWGWGQDSPPEVHICSPAWSRANCASTGRSSCAWTRAQKSATVIGDEVERR